MRPGPKSKKTRKRFLLILPFLPFLLLFIPQGIYNAPYANAAETQKSAEDARKLPLIYWPGGIESADSLKQAGVDRFAAPPEKAAAWRKAGFKVVAVSQAELGRREKLLTPRVAGRSNVAAATQRPWIDSNGWPQCTKAGFVERYSTVQKRLTGAVHDHAHVDELLSLDSRNDPHHRVVKGWCGHGWPPRQRARALVAGPGESRRRRVGAW